MTDADLSSLKAVSSASVGRNCAPCHAAMPAFGRDGILKRPDIEHVASFVPSLVGLRLGPKIDLAAGKQILPTIPGEPRNLT